MNSGHLTVAKRNNWPPECEMSSLFALLLLWTLAEDKLRPLSLSHCPSALAPRKAVDMLPANALFTPHFGLGRIYLAKPLGWTWLLSTWLGRWMKCHRTVIEKRALVCLIGSLRRPWSPRHQVFLILRLPSRWLISHDLPPLPLPTQGWASSGRSGHRSSAFGLTIDSTVPWAAPNAQHITAHPLPAPAPAPPSVSAHVHTQIHLSNIYIHIDIIYI